MPNTKSVTSETHSDTTDNSLLVTRESVIDELRNKLEQRFNSMRDQAMSTTSVWERYDIDVILKELKFVYENILK